MELKEFLSWLIASGGSVSAASWILERVDWFQAQEAKFKEQFFFMVSSAIAILAYLGVTYIPEDVITMISPYFSIIAAVFSSVIIGKAFHKVDKTE